MAKLASIIHSLDGKSFGVVETLPEIRKEMSAGVTIRYCIELTQANGDPVWVNLLHVCRVEST